jgi:hypothetical protein
MSKIETSIKKSRRRLQRMQSIQPSPLVGILSGECHGQSAIVPTIVDLLQDHAILRVSETCTQLAGWKFYIKDVIIKSENPATSVMVSGSYRGLQSLSLNLGADQVQNLIDSCDGTSPNYKYRQAGLATRRLKRPSMCQALQSVTNLNLQGSPLSGEDVDLVVSLVPNTKVLKLGHASRYSLETFTQKFKHLEEVVMSDMVYYAPSLSLSCLASIPNLRVLDLLSRSICNQEIIECLAGVIKTCQNLEQLYLPMYPASRGIVNNLRLYCSRLTHLTITIPNIQEMYELLRQEKLEYLEINFHIQQQRFQEFILNLPKVHSLKHFGLIGSFSNKTDTTLHDKLSNFPNLQSLVLKNYTNMLFRGPFAVNTLVPERLTVLKVDYSITSINGQLLKDALTQLPLLESLSITNPAMVNTLTDVYRELSRSCPRLQHLTLVDQYVGTSANGRELLRVLQARKIITLRLGLMLQYNLQWIPGLVSAMKKGHCKSLVTLDLPYMTKSKFRMLADTLQTGHCLDLQRLIVANKELVDQRRRCDRVPFVNFSSL